MTSLFGRMLPLFTDVRRVEDLFTEAVARLFERRPDICLGWLESLDLISISEEDRQRHIVVSTQKTFVALEGHDTGSRPDMIVDVSHVSEDDQSEPYTELVMFESKVGSIEGGSQLHRYATHLENLSGDRKTLVYVTRAYDPKDKAEILAGTDGIRFRQLRWHDFYKFLQNFQKDALSEEVMLFMEEQGMSRSHRLSTTDLTALSGVPRAFEIFDETLGDDVKAELEKFAGHRILRENMWNIRGPHRRYQIRAPLQGEDLACSVGFQLRMVANDAHESILRLTDESYPKVYVYLEGKSDAVERETSTKAMRILETKRRWEAYNLDNSSGWFGVRRYLEITDFLSEEDHIFAIKQFFIESIRQLREELTEFKKENPDLPWNGGS